MQRACVGGGGAGEGGVYLRPVLPLRRCPSPRTGMRGALGPDPLSHEKRTRAVGAGGSTVVPWAAWVMGRMGCDLPQPGHRSTDNALQRGARGPGTCMCPHAHTGTAHNAPRRTPGAHAPGRCACGGTAVRPRARRMAPVVRPLPLDDVSGGVGGGGDVHSRGAAGAVRGPHADRPLPPCGRVGVGVCHWGRGGPGGGGGVRASGHLFWGRGPSTLWIGRGGGGWAQGLGIRLFAFGGAYWPLLIPTLGGPQRVLVVTWGRGGLGGRAREEVKGGGGFGWDPPPSSQGPPMAPPKGGQTF